MASRLVGLLFAALLAVPALAQSVPDWAAPHAAPAEVPDALLGPGPPPPPPPPPPVPLDGGLGLLALAGSAYAARHLRRRGA